MVCRIAYVNILTYILSFETGVPRVFYIQGSVSILDKPNRNLPLKDLIWILPVFSYVLKLIKAVAEYVSSS